MTLLIVAIGLSVALTGVLYFGKADLFQSETNFLTNSIDHQSLRRLNRDEKSIDAVESYQTSAAFVAQEPTLTNADVVDESSSPATENSTVSVDDFCMTPGCVNTAALILQNLDQTVDPCEDFYQFACGGFVERTDIPNDRTRMSTFSVLGDELLTQVTALLWPISNNGNNGMTQIHISTRSLRGFTFDCP